MSSSQNGSSDKQPDNLVDELGTNLSELELKADDELQRQLSPAATRYTTTGSNISGDDRIVTDGILGTSIFPEETRNHFSLPDHGTFVTNDSTHEDETFPAFLGGAQVVEAMRRAGDLFQQRHGLNGITPLAPPVSDWARLRALYGLTPFVANPEPELPFLALPALTKAEIQGYADTSYAIPGSGVHAKFAAGNESSSVLQITKRPKLRSKDIAHRRSLGDPQQSSSDVGLPLPPNLRRDDSSPLHYFGPDAGNVAPAQFLLNLLFGTRGVGVPVSLDMDVNTLVGIAAGIANLEPRLVSLRYGTVDMRPGMFLRDYFSRADHQGMTITVVMQMTSPRVLAPSGIARQTAMLQSTNLTHGTAAPQSVSPHGSTLPDDRSVSSGTPPTPAHLFGETMYSIRLVYEDGHVVTQIVWLDMLVAQLTVPDCGHSVSGGSCFGFPCLSWATTRTSSFSWYAPCYLGKCFCLCVFQLPEYVPVFVPWRWPFPSNTGTSSTIWIISHECLIPDARTCSSSWFCPPATDYTGCGWFFLWQGNSTRQVEEWFSVPKVSWRSAQLEGLE
jgi:hypothetical protein